MPLVLASPHAAWAQTGGPFQPLIHVVQQGETLFAIADRYGTTVEAITHANGVPDPRQIYVGQRLLIPGGIEPVETWSAHVVRPGETLATIATLHGLAWRSLALANRLVNPHLLYAGQVLRLPAPSGRTGALHAVQPGETMAAIALHHGLGSWYLMAANGIANPALVLPGQWLFIPGEQPAWMPLPFASVEVTPVPVQQGQTMLVAVRATDAVPVDGLLFDRPMAFAEEGGVFYAVVGVHAFTEPGLYEMTLGVTSSSGQRVSTSVGVVVEEGGYGHERIDVPASRTNLLDPALVVAEQERMSALQVLFTPARNWHGPFIRPVEAAINSYFGTRRSYGGPYNSYHSGVDFNAGRGTPVHAVADGTVVFAEPLAVRGDVVVIDHGWGVLTGYWHLSSIDVAVGQEVRTGDVVGRVGNTGLSTGAHLHWEVWAGGVSVDGLQWLEPVYPWVGLDPADSSP